MASIPAELRAVFEKYEVPRADWGKPSGLLIAFAHSLQVPAGKHVKQPLRLRKFQIEFVRAVYNSLDASGSRYVRQALLSVARRNGKTLMASVILLAHLAGPFKKPNSTIISAATSQEQARLVYNFVRDMVQANPWLLQRVKVIESTKRIIHREDKSYYKAIAADAGSQFGMGIDLVVYDELAQAKNRSLYDTLMTSLGSQIEPLMLIISTQAPADQHLLSELIDYGSKVSQGIIDDPSFVAHVYSVPMDADWLDEKQWKKANPGLGDFRGLQEMRTAVHRAAKGLPSDEGMVRNLYLNQRIRADQPYLSPSVFEKGAGPINLEIFNDGRAVYGGIDLSARTDLTGLVWAAEDDDGVIHLLPRAWTPDDTLVTRAQRDRAPYDVWARNGHLITVPGTTIDYDWVAQALADDTGGGMNVIRLNYDRWRIDILRQALARMGAAVPLNECGQGYKDMSPCVEAFEELALAGRIRHGGHPLLRWCFSNAVVVRDAGGNRKLDKAKAYGRIDVAVAAIMAVGAMKATGQAAVDTAALIA